LPSSPHVDPRRRNLKPMPPTPIQTFRVKLPDGDILGVLSEARIKKLIRSGVIGPDAMLQRVGSQIWRRADQVASGVFRELPSPPAPSEEPDDPFAFRPLPPDFEQTELGGVGMPAAPPMIGSGGGLPTMPTVRATRSMPAPEGETAVTGAFLFMAWLCVPTLMFDLVLWIFIAFVGANQPDLLPRSVASQMVWLLPSPYVTSILLCVLTAWAGSRMPEHARDAGIGVWVTKWIMLSLLPILLLLVIRALSVDSTRVPFIIAGVGLTSMMFACDVPASLTRSLNDRIVPEKWKVSWWLGPTAAGFMVASCLFAGAANAWMATISWTNDELSLWARFQQSGVLLLVLAVLGIGTRLIGLLLVAIWGIQLGFALRRVPMSVLSYRGRFD
jgi:hypothetical protein